MMPGSFFNRGVFFTLVAVLFGFFNPGYEVFVFLLLIISSFWILCFYKVNTSLNNHKLVVDRVEQLKKFSIDLQSLINKELALVQEDIIRTKGIVSDSIGILQKSASDINMNMNLQKQYLESISEMLSADGNDVVASDVGKTFLDIVNTNASSDENSERSIEYLNRKNKDSIDNMMLALQFEDIVSQISERVAQHVGDIRMTVDILSRLCESEFSTSFQQDLEKMRVEYASIKDKLLSVSSRNFAEQKNMDEGDIELF